MAKKRKRLVTMMLLRPTERQLDILSLHYLMLHDVTA